MLTSTQFSTAISTSSMSVFMYLTRFSIPSRCPVNVNGPVIPTIIGNSSYFSFKISIASKTTGILPLLVKSSVASISSAYSNGEISTSGTLSLLPRLTSHPNASASTVRQNGNLAHSSPASSYKELASVAI